MEKIEGDIEINRERGDKERKKGRNGERYIDIEKEEEKDREVKREGERKRERERERERERKKKESKIWKENK